MLNRIVLIGRLTRDPESSYTTNGIAVSKFGLAVNRPTKNSETGDYEVDFFDIVAWRRTAEFVTQYVTKGRLVSVDGRLQSRSWVAQDGSKRKAFEIVADNIQTLDRPKEGNGGGGSYQGGEEPEFAGARAGGSPPPMDAADDSDPFADE